jgi:hypothetical protein
MPLIKCPECENEISDKVDTVCPKCGFVYSLEEKDRDEIKNMPLWKQIFQVTLGLTILIVVSLFFIGASGFSHTNEVRYVFAGLYLLLAYKSWNLMVDSHKLSKIYFVGSLVGYSFFMIFSN